MGGADVPSFGMSAPVGLGAHTEGIGVPGSAAILAASAAGWKPALPGAAPESGSADPRCWGPRLVCGPTEEPQTPTPGVRATQLRALLICLGAVLAAAFKKIKNRGSELKDLLQRQGITEIATSKRTHFRAEKAALDVARSGISRIFGLAVPVTGAILQDPG